MEKKPRKPRAKETKPREVKSVLALQLIKSKPGAVFYVDKMPRDITSYISQYCPTRKFSTEIVLVVSEYLGDRSRIKAKKITRVTVLSR